MKSEQLLFVLLLLAATGAWAADTTVTVTGTVRDNTCTVQTGAANFTVNLLQTASKQLNIPGGVSPSVPFSIRFSRCGAAASAVRIGFTGNASPDNSNLLKTDSGTNAAQGVAVQILSESLVPLNLNASEDDLPWISLTGGQPATLKFWARMMAVRSPIVAGTVSATAGVTLEFQ